MDLQRERIAPRVIESPALVDRLIACWGGAATSACFEPGIAWFRNPVIEGAIAFRRAGAYAIAFGDPLCAPEHRDRLSGQFRAACAAEGLAVVWVAISPSFAESAVARGAAVLEFAGNVVLASADPRRGRGGRRGRKLRNRLRRAEEAGVRVVEYDRGAAPDPELERELAALVDRWLAARGGPLSLGHIRLFDHPAVKRWIVARGPSGVVGVLAMLRAPALGGWLADDFITTRDGPAGTSELLVVRAVELLAGDALAFGPTARAELGLVIGLHAGGERFARRAYHLVGRVAGFARHAHYLEKFNVARTEPSFLAFDPPELHVSGLLAIVRAFRAHARPLETESDES